MRVSIVVVRFLRYVRMVCSYGSRPKSLEWCLGVLADHTRRAVAGSI